MQIKISQESANIMARLLSQSVQTALGKPPAEALSQSQSLEILSKTLGFDNWETLSQMLTSERACTEVAVVAPHAGWSPEKKQYAQSIGWREKPPLVSKPFNFYWEALACSEWGDGPQWANLYVTQAFVDALHEWQTKCLDMGATLTFKAAPDAWDSEDEYRLLDDEININGNQFWFSAHPKHANYNVETRILAIKDFFDAIDNPWHQLSHLAWADNLLFMDGSSAKNFAQLLLDSGEITISEASIEKMPS